MASGAGIGKAIKRAGKRLANTRLDPFFIARMRFVLFIAAIMALTLAFMARDDWFVSNFANYDWARDLGF